jgi:hypothetical protein
VGEDLGLGYFWVALLAATRCSCLEPVPVPGVVCEGGLSRELIEWALDRGGRRTGMTCMK